MYRFFVNEKIDSGKNIYISGSDYNHIKNVLRMKKGEEVLISDGNDREYLCSICEYTDDEVILNIEDIMGTSRELSAKITLFQGFQKAIRWNRLFKKQ